MSGEPVEFEVPAFDGATPVFLAWAGHTADVRVAFGPDPILAVDEPGRRGYLIDDIYFAVAWVAEGGSELARALDDAGIAALSRVSQHQASEDLLRTVMQTGSPARPAADR